MSLPIHPETRVGALLDAYPGIEDALIRWVPAFAKLRNPILRRTVAKVATLEQAARIGGIGVRELVLKLREETGQATDTPCAESYAEPQVPEKPDWPGTLKVRETIDAEAMLATGVHPLGKVRRAAEELSAGEAVLVVSPFRPEPLIDALSKAGFAVYSREARPGVHETLIGRVGESAA